MFLFVTLRFLSNLRITFIASFFYFLHVSLVCFNVSCTTELIKAFINHCFNERQCLTVCTNLFSIIFLNKQDWTPYVHSLTEKFPYSLTISISIQCSYSLWGCVGGYIFLYFFFPWKYWHFCLSLIATDRSWRVIFSIILSEKYVSSMFQPKVN